MREGRESKRDQAFESFMNHAQHEARLDSRESPYEHAARLLSEIHEDINAGIQTREEAIALLAKLDIVLESIKDPGIMAEAKEFQSDIKSRYPNLLN